MAQYFFKVDGVVNGPIDAKELKRLFESREVVPERVMIRREDRDEWVSATKSPSDTGKSLLPAPKLAPAMTKKRQEDTPVREAVEIEVVEESGHYGLAADALAASRAKERSHVARSAGPPRSRETKKTTQSSSSVWIVGLISGLVGISIGSGSMYLMDRSLVTPVAGSASIPAKVEAPSVLPRLFAKSEKSKIEETINGFMKEQENGREGLSYWKNQSLASRFFAVRSWKILDFEVTENSENEIVPVRIDASNRGGNQITALWKFFMVRDGDQWKISMISDTKD